MFRGAEIRVGVRGPFSAILGSITMSQIVEISLRIPSLRATNGINPTAKIENAEVRLSKQVQVDRIPKPGDVLDMTADSGDPVKCVVVGSDWRDDKKLFVVSC